jgi:uncharacterized protein (DUF427 family)/uncharacterized protein YbjT (DUF2867 family)
VQISDEKEIRMEALVMGATGKTGRRVVDALLARGIAVRAANRTPAPARDGVTPVVFDWGDRGTWDGVAGDAKVMYMVGPGKLADPGLLVDRLLAGLPRVRRVVALSDIEADTVDGDTWPNKAIERAVQRSGMEWTVLRSNWFHQNFTENQLFTAPIDADGEIVAPVGDARVSFVDAADLAEVAAITMTTGGHDGRTYLLTGPEALTFEQVAAALTDAGRKVRHADVTPGEMDASLTARGLPAPVVELFGFLFRQIREGHNQEVTDTVEQLTGRPARPFLATLLAEARDPDHQVDVQATAERVRVELDGVTLADSTGARLLSETGLPPRYYIPATDVRMDLLVPSNRVTQCPYKGTARYWSVRIGDRLHRDIAWSYPAPPLPESRGIAGLIAFWKADVTIDGLPQQAQRA